MSFSYVNIEESILKKWRENSIFQKQIKKNQYSETFSYYDGPPFATGLPHYGHIVASILKDIIPRYKAMCGYNVPRIWCWDVHGLPIEFEIEKKLGIKTRDDIFKMGIYNYNEECRSIVMTYSEQWKSTIERIGRWVDMENNIKTMDLSYMDSVWWVFSRLWDQNLVYQGCKVMPYSTGCGTPLSNFEAKSNYRKVNDPSITVMFPIFKDTFLLVWTTTPWTLISNMALCVHPDLTYVEVLWKGKKLILLKSALKKYGFDESSINEHFTGSFFANLHYQPIFSYFSDFPNAFKVLCDKYVKEDNGTGIVHLAPAFGEDDYRVCIENGIIDKTISPPCPFNANGYFNNEIDIVKNMYFKDADKVIMKDLTDRELMFKQKWEAHEYPFCWRSNTPLMYRIVPCTFINVEKIKINIIQNNKTDTNWVPNHLKMGRFGNWLEEAKDWCVSRNRFWGTPIPIWKSGDGNCICISSCRQLENLAELPEGAISDLHRHHIDKITFFKDGKFYKRIDEVFDCWFESGSLPFASQKYPDSEYFSYPADYIAEGLDQTRGWFYTLMVIGTAILNQSPFKNVIVNGLVLAEDGEKMSKSKRNYPDPNEILNKYGADALRLYLIGTPIIKGEPLKFKESGVANIIKTVHQFTFNSLEFLKQMIPLYEQKFNEKFIYYNFNENPEITNVSDLMLLNYLQDFVTNIHNEMDTYYLGNIVSRIEQFIAQLSRTYLNMNKSRLKSLFGKEPALSSLNTMFYTMRIFSIIIAPFAPFMADYIFLELCKLDGTNAESVHLENMPDFVWKTDCNASLGKKSIDLLEGIIDARGHLRSKVLNCAKKPVLRQIITLKDPELIPILEAIKEPLQKECNTMDIIVRGNYEELVRSTFEIDNANIGKRFRKNAKKMRDILSSYKVEDFVRNAKGNIIVEMDGENYELIDEIKIVEEMKEIEVKEGKYVQYNRELGMIIVSDLSWNEDVNTIFWMKMIVRNIMDARKKMGLVPTDKALIKILNKGVSRILEENMDDFISQIDMQIVESNINSKNYNLNFDMGEMKYEFTIFQV